jgi:uncharacterized protein YecT (DUF1311 family)
MNPARDGIVFGMFFLLGILPISGQEISLQQAKEDFARFDRRLNEVYQQARGALPEWRFETVQKQQRQWIEYRDSRALAAAVFDGGAEQGKEKQNAEYWNALAYLTETRVSILEAWMKIDSFPKAWEGAWIDGYGGLLLIAEPEEGVIEFSIDVVRGPTHHSGGVGGKAEAKNVVARFSILPDGADEEMWLTFLNEDGQVRVIGVNTSYFHGARAYFDGNYLRVRDLTDEDRKAIKEAAEW